jgi:hypothetical protein
LIGQMTLLTRLWINIKIEWKIKKIPIYEIGIFFF